MAGEYCGLKTCHDRRSPSSPPALFPSIGSGFVVVTVGVLNGVGIFSCFGRAGDGEGRSE
jgi:hypothetical protein